VVHLKNKKIAFKILNSLNKNKNSLSVTLTGSYSEHFDPLKAGDIDIVIICKKLNKKFFNECISILKKNKQKYFGNKYELIINSTFGPIKFYKKNTIVFHLMIYDLKSHIIHTINSPFTCYDWERSKIYVGKSLKELSPVYNLQFRDFSEARRNTQEYLKDLSKNRISYREYNFKNRKIELIKKYFEIDQLNKRDFIYHIIKFLLINYIKYESQKNLEISRKKIQKKFLEIVKNKFDLSEFNKLILLKTKKEDKSIQEPKKLAIRFLNKFDQYIKKQKAINNIYFSRHKKTNVKKNIFLGQKLNPNIIEKKNDNEFTKIKFDRCFSSPSLRCRETAKIVAKNKKIITNNLLKEIDYGDAEGLDLKELNKKYPEIIDSWKKALDPRFPNGESLKDVNARLKKFIKNKVIFKNFNYLIFTHNVVLRCLIGSIYKINKKEWYKININYFDLLEFISKNGRLIGNIDRKKYLNIFKNFY
jgi:ribonuclease H / adenosylcobalamin/alpha-ribazole phosphatase